MIKRKFHIFVSMFLCLLSVSCTYDIDLEGLDKEGKIFLICTPGGADMTVFNMKTSVPVSTGKHVQTSVSDATVSLIADGKDVMLEKSDGSIPGVPSGYWYTGQKFAPGTVLEMKASLDGVPAVSARTSVPAASPEFRLSVEPVQLTGKDAGVQEGLAFIVTFEDRENCRYYGMQVLTRVPDSSKPEGYYEYFKSPFYMGTNTGFSNLDPMLAVSYSRYSGPEDSSDAPMVLWDCNDETGAEQTLRLDFLYEDYTIDGDNEKSEFKVFVYRLSPEFYRYAKAVFIASDNPLINMGLASPSFTYTNVSGGLGLFGAVSCAESDWTVYLKKHETAGEYTGGQIE